jgi:ADP-ribose pyrophosphatase YjhB (NUDIX family)
MNQPPESVAGIVFSPDRSRVLLILRRDVPVWVLPGGGIDSGESSENATIREILEETGLSVKVERLVGLYLPINRLAKRTVLYECSVISGNPQGSDETRMAQFFPLDQLPPMPPPYPEWIEEGKVPGGAPIHRELHSVNYTTLCKYALSHPILVLRFLLARAGLSINTN